MARWIDAHNHLQDARLGGDVVGMIRQMKEVGVEQCVVNATEEADWLPVAGLAQAHPEFVRPAFGIHPWKASTARAGWQDRLMALLDQHPGASVGEAGLDQWVSEPCIEVQRPVFSEQLRIAREMKRPLTIHALKAWGALFDVFAVESPPEKFLMHSFGGSIEVAERLLALGAYFSFSGYFLSDRKSKVVDVFRQLPVDRILLETDAPDMLPPAKWVTHRLENECNHPANLDRIAVAFSKQMGLTVSELSELSVANARRLFG